MRLLLKYKKKIPAFNSPVFISAIYRAYLR